MKTSTPRTDEKACNWDHEGQWVNAEFCRDMERELRDLVMACNQFGAGSSMSHPRYTSQLSAARKFLQNT